MIDGGLRKEYRTRLPAVHWQAIETGLTGRGVPDTNGCWQGVEAWIENKKAKGWQVKMRSEQIAWLERRIRAGGRAFIAVRRTVPASAQRPASDALWLLAGHAGRHLINKGGSLQNLPKSAILGCWQGGPSGWDWAAFAKCLFSHGENSR